MDNIIQEFVRIRNLGFIKSNRSNHTGIGKTFEDYLGVKENNIKDSDFDGFEVKSQRFLAGSKITLFTKSPTEPKQANSYLRDNYGKNDRTFPELKALHTSFYSNRFNTYLGKFAFKLEIQKNRDIMILIKEIESDSVIDKSIIYKYEDIQASIRKLEKLFVVTAESKVVDEVEYFHYTKAKVFLEFKLDKFYELLESGDIQFDIRIGSYKTGTNFGKAHDHGSGFRIHRAKLDLLFENILEID